MPTTIVRRPEARAELDRLSAKYPVTLVCAPAGYGKTLLLADWAEATGVGDKVWVSLDADDTPARLWSAVRRALEDLDRSGQRVDDRTRPAAAVADVIDVLTALTAPVHLILDDLHEIHDAGTLHELATLIRHQPDTLRLVLASRTDPPLPLARLRLQGRLAELRTPRLRFDLAEAAELMRGTGVTPGEQELDTLLSQTDGWPAGLRLASALPRAPTGGGPDLSARLAHDRATTDYLASEVLAQLPAETEEFLRTISICEEVTPALAAALTERDDAGAVLAGLERITSLVRAHGTDRPSYRMHPMLRDHLRADLARRSPALLSDLHAVAASWCTAHEQVRAAFAHAARTDDTTPAQELLRRYAVKLILTGDHATVEATLDKVGRAAAARDPLLTLVALLARLADGQPFDEFRSGGATGDLAELERLAVATSALVGGVVSPGDEAAWRALVVTHRGGDFEAWARLGLGWCLLAAGDGGAARPELELAERLARDNGFDQISAHCLVGQGVLAALSGDFARMAEVSAHALAFADDTGWRQLSWIATAHLLIGVHRILTMDSAGALSSARRAEAACGWPTPAPMRALIDFITGIASFDEGDRATSLDQLHRARQEAAKGSLPSPVPITIAVLEHQAALAAGQHALAQRVEAWTREQQGDTAELAVMRARTALARGELSEVAAALRPVIGGDVPMRSPETPLELRLLVTALEARMGRRTRARHALVEALTLAERGDKIRPFHYADPAVRRLLTEQMGGFGPAEDFATKVRHALSTRDTPPDNVLTAREQSVLVLLSTPRSLDELATDLSVSVNTVKTHVRAIYTKLGVNNRRAAVMAARHLGLT